MQRKLGFYIEKTYSTILADDNNEYHFCCNGFPVRVKSNFDMEKLFRQKAKLVLDYEFSKKIKGQIEMHANENEFIFYIDSSSQYLSIYKINNKCLDACIIYNSYRDTINVNFYDENVSDDMVKDILNIKIHKSQLSDYHISLIESNKIAEKPINLDQSQISGFVNFDIDEDEKQVVLRKNLKIKK